MKKRGDIVWLFGPLSVALQWVGLVWILYLAGPIDLNKPFSLVSIAPFPVPLIFGLTLTLAGFTLFLFSFAFEDHHHRIPQLAFFAGFFFALTGWLRFDGTGGWLDTAHLTALYAGTIIYLLVIWQIRSHKIDKISKHSSMYFAALALLAPLAGVGLFFRSLVSFLELSIFIITQVWIVAVAFHGHRTQQSTHSTTKEGA